MAVGESDTLLWRDPVLGRNGIELQRGMGGRFGPQIRNEATIAVIVSGELRCRIGRGALVAAAGQVVLVPAGEAFAVETEGWSWRVLYPDLDTLADLGSELPAAVPGYEPDYAQRFIILHRSIEANVDNPLARQQAFVAVIGLVLSRAVLPPGWPGRPYCDASIRRAVACVKARFCDPALSVADLAAAAGCSPYHFMRRFQEVVGVTAHAYIVQCRLHAARALLAAGVPAAEVAPTVGFVDQSHLIRQFKAFHGLTPGRYADACRRRSGHRSVAAGIRLQAE